MTEQPLLARLADFVAGTDPARLPNEVVEGARLRVLDVLGICVAALCLDTSRAVRSFVEAQGGVETCSAVGCSKRVPAVFATLVNGTLAHSLDYDDTHLPSVLHPSATIVPACLAAAEQSGSSGRQLLEAIATGLEVCVRLGMAGYDSKARNSTYFDRGQHATSICGAVAGAGAVARLFEMGPEKISDAMAIAASMASGVIEANRAGGTVKRLHCGWAAHSAVSAAELARLGFSGPPSALEGRFGLFQALLGGRFDAGAITEGLGEQWLMSDIQFKPYPANHFTHGGIDAALALARRGLRVEEIESLALGVAGPTVRTIGEPIERKRAPETGYEAQFSGPYTVAAALLGGHGLGLGLDDFSDGLARDPKRRSIMEKVVVVEDPWCNAIFPEQFPAVLVARTTSGETLVEKVESNRGGPQRPLSAGDVARKFRDNAARGLEAADVSALELAVASLPERSTVTDLLDIARGARGSGAAVGER